MGKINATLHTDKIKEPPSWIRGCKNCKTGFKRFLLEGNPYPLRCPNCGEFQEGF